VPVAAAAARSRHVQRGLVVRLLQGMLPACAQRWRHWCCPATPCRGLLPEERGYLRGRVLQLIPQEDNQVWRR
jgi:hypothetical protein